MRSFLIAQREKRSSFACSFLFQLTSLPTTVKLSYLFSTEALSCKLQGAGNHMFKNSLPFFFFRASSKTKEWLKKLMKPFANQNWKPVDLKKNSTRNIKWDILSKVIPFFPIVWQHFSLPLPIKLSQSQSTVANHATFELERQSMIFASSCGSITNTILHHPVFHLIATLFDKEPFF